MIVATEAIVVHERTDRGAETAFQVLFLCRGCGSENTGLKVAAKDSYDKAG
jgi:hypothetical protein